MLLGYPLDDPRLLSVAAVEALKQARLIIAPAGADGVWSLGGADVERVEAPAGGLRASDAFWNRLVAALDRGETVVRCYAADPLADPVGAAEARALAATGIPFEFVPGTSPLLAGATYAGVPLDRGPITLLTSRWLRYPTHSLAADGVALVEVPSGGAVADVASSLVAAGLPAECAAVLIRQAGTPAQVIHAGSLRELIEHEMEPECPLALLIAGDAVRERLAWFERRPLFGKRVLVTRAEGQAGTLSALLRDRGAEPVELPAIRIAPPQDPAALDAAIRRLGEYDWVVFSSVNGVDALFARLDALGLDARAFGHGQLAAIGRATTARLRERGLRADFVPERFVAEAVLAGLVERGAADSRVLLPRAEQARDVLPEGLRAAGAQVDVVAAYRTLPPEPPADVLRRLEAGEIDIITLASSSTARNLLALVKGRTTVLNRSLIACIGPVTADTAREIGLRVDVVADEYTIPGLVDALVQVVERSQ